MKIIIIGASNDEEKFGNKIMKDLIGKGHDVVPVNPNEKEVEGIRTHKLLNTVPKNFDIVNFVVPPNVTLQILKRYTELLKTKKLWIQPGSEDEEVKLFLQENDFTDIIIGSCIIVEEIN